MTECGCGEEAVGRGDDDPLLLSTSRQLTPKLRGLDIEAEDSVGELALQGGKPRRESSRFLPAASRPMPLAISPSERTLT